VLYDGEILDLLWPAAKPFPSFSRNGGIARRVAAHEVHWRQCNSHYVKCAID